jgi:hypothetical protein
METIRNRLRDVLAEYFQYSIGDSEDTAYERSGDLADAIFDEFVVSPGEQDIVGAWIVQAGPSEDQKD